VIVIDSHCHLDFEDFDKDFCSVIKRAHSNSVKGLQTICTRLEEFENIWSIAKSYKGIWCSVGVHPHNVEESSPFTIDDIVTLANRDRVIGIGETGLDFYYDHAPRGLQIESFIKHLDASKEIGLPVIVHTRDAEEETCKILKSSCKEGELKGVIHCFSGGSSLADCALELGFYISLSGIVTFKNASNIREICSSLPLERILVETDSPYLAPVPHRGKRNEPAYVTETLKIVAELKNITTEEMASITTDNFFRLFSKASVEDIDK